MPSANMPLEPVVERSRPVLAALAHGLRALGRLAQALSLSGMAGATLLTLGAIRIGGWWGAIALVAFVLPWRAWLVGHHAVAGASLLADPGRLSAAAQSSAGAGRQWLDHLSTLRTAPRGRRLGSATKAVVGTGRTVWTLVSPSIEGASSLRELAIWPKTVSGLGAAVACPILFLIGAVAALVSLI